MKIRPALESEVVLLTSMSKAAFDSDTLVGAPGPGGPPEYDNAAWHEQMRREGHLYAIVDGDRPVGGLLPVFDKGVLYLGRIFIAPDKLRMGYGEAGMLFAETLYPGAKSVCLDTPIWNTRTNGFYQKLGYREARRDEHFIYYEKMLPGGTQSR